MQISDEQIEELTQFSNKDLRENIDDIDIKNKIKESIDNLNNEILKIKKLIQLQALKDVDLYNYSLSMFYEKNNRPFLNCSVRLNQKSLSIFWQKTRIFKNPKTGQKQIINKYIKMRNGDGYSPIEFRSEDENTRTLALSTEERFKLSRKKVKQLTEIGREVGKLNNLLNKD